MGGPVWPVLHGRMHEGSAVLLAGIHCSWYATGTLGHCVNLLWGVLLAVHQLTPEPGYSLYLGETLPIYVKLSKIWTFQFLVLKNRGREGTVPPTERPITEDWYLDVLVIVVLLWETIYTLMTRGEEHLTVKDVLWIVLYLYQISLHCIENLQILHLLKIYWFYAGWRRLHERKNICFHGVLWTNLHVKLCDVTHFFLHVTSVMFEVLALTHLFGHDTSCGLGSWT